MKIGYSTGTFDMLHECHINFLKTSKNYCDKLIIGLTTDDVGIKQKRKPCLSYEHRKILLESNKYVDSVVPNRGLSKQMDYQRLKFDVLLIGDDYFNYDEYSSFQKDYPNIEVIYIPRGEGTSTSLLLREIFIRMLTDEQSVKAMSLNGEIFNYSIKKNENILTKYIRIGKNEIGETKNCYNLKFPPLRNWKLIKHKDDNKNPFISGVNAIRELEINIKLKDCDFSRYIIHKLLKEFNNVKAKELPENYLERIEVMNDERRFPGRLYIMVMDDGGVTLDEYVKDLPIEKRIEVYKKIKNNIDILREKKIMHMDLHCKNILVDIKGKVSFIDYGWGMSSDFEMCEEEKKYFQKSFDENFDLKHFSESLVVMGVEKDVIDLT